MKRNNLKKEIYDDLVSIASKFHINKVEEYDYRLIVCVLGMYVAVIVRRIITIKWYMNFVYNK